jgi:hypothetical protein
MHGTPAAWQYPTPSAWMTQQLGVALGHRMSALHRTTPSPQPPGAELSMQA